MQQQQQRAACHCLLFSLFTFSFFFFNFSGGLSLEFLNPISTGAEFEYGAIL
jgi:hypothetical protein